MALDDDVEHQATWHKCCMGSLQGLVRYFEVYSMRDIYNLSSKYVRCGPCRGLKTGLCLCLSRMSKTLLLASLDTIDICPDDREPLGVDVPRWNPSTLHDLRLRIARPSLCFCLTSQFRGFQTKDPTLVSGLPWLTSLLLWPKYSSRVCCSSTVPCADWRF